MRFLDLSHLERVPNDMVGVDRLLVNPKHITYVATCRTHLGWITKVSLDSPEAGGMANATSIDLLGNHLQAILDQLELL